ncbi:hypothetical protein E2C01_102621 [Portunus trituberculatus]|uniref:Uncharacterized protein n=1 Tax=Portunus trituberculatus TaxID=210409 RepID=A0A5B7KDS3_PORTR|nr:hypothetical protein [Portunus trituberculatus]
MDTHSKFPVKGRVFRQDITFRQQLNR